jgi:hypothetical protein
MGQRRFQLHPTKPAFFVRIVLVMTGRPARRDKSRPVRLSPTGRGAERSQQPLQGKSDDTHCATSPRATELRGVRNQVFAQANQTVNPVPLTPPSVNTTTTTCQINCDTQAMFCQNSCIPTTAAAATNPAAPASSGACNLSCTSQQLVCKQRC